MSDLISRKAVENAIRCYFHKMIENHIYAVDCVDCNADLQALISVIKTAHDVDKVVERLEEEIDSSQNGCEAEYRAGLYKAIDIVKAGGEE